MTQNEGGRRSFKLSKLPYQWETSTVHLDALPVNHDEDALEERLEQKQNITWSDNSADGSLKRHINNIYPWQV